MMPFAFSHTTSWILVPAIMATAIPSLLWRWFFQDENSVPVWLIVITVFYVALSLSPDEVGMTLAPHLDLSQFVFVLLPEIIKLGLVLHVI